MTAVREYILKIYPQMENIEIWKHPFSIKICPNLEHISRGNRHQ